MTSGGNALAEWIGANAVIVLAILVALLIVAVITLVQVWRWTTTHRKAVWEWLASRYPASWGRLHGSPLRVYLGLHLAFGLALSGAILLFLSLGERLAAGRALVSFDLALAAALHRSATAQGLRTFEAITALGSGRALVALGIIVGVALLVGRRPILCFGWVIAMAGGSVLNGALKTFYQRPRPEFADPVVYRGSWSFPSGHAMGTFIACGMLVYLAFLVFHSPMRRVIIAGLALAWIVVMGFSRMYLGVHYFSDVVAGFAGGTAWLAACISAIELARKAGPRAQAPSE